MADPVTVIQATLAPIFLVSGAAIFLNFTQARLFRVVDRLRAVGGELGKVGEATRRKDLLHQRTRAIRRAVILRNAILFGVLVIAFTVVTTLLILASAAGEGFDPGGWPIVTFAAGLVAFTVALALVVADAFIYGGDGAGGRPGVRGGAAAGRGVTPAWLASSLGHILVAHSVWTRRTEGRPVTDTKHHEGGAG